MIVMKYLQIYKISALNNLKGINQYAIKQNLR